MDILHNSEISMDEENRSSNKLGKIWKDILNPLLIILIKLPYN